MGFAQYLINSLNGTRVLESVTSAPADTTKAAVDQISGKVGGDISNSAAVKSAYEALEQSFDSIALEYFDNAENPGLEEIFGFLIKKHKGNAHKKNLNAVNKKGSKCFNPIPITE